MSAAVALKLVAIFVIVAIGWIVGRLGWLTPAEARAPSRLRIGGARTREAEAEADDDVVRSPALSPGVIDPSRALANAAYYIFVPALLFRTTARIDFHALPWRTLAAVFLPLAAMLIAVYGLQRRTAAARSLPPAAPATRAITSVFGNTTQVGIPMASALFGERGLQIHLAIVSLHALVLLTLATTFVELDVARADPREGSRTRRLAATLGRTVQRTLIHPVVLPVLAGLAWNAAGFALPGFVDEVLLTLGQAVVPLCLVLIGMSLAYYGVQGAARSALGLCLVKLAALPALVLAVAHYGFGLAGLPLTVVVMMAALPIGSNALIFAQRYRVLEAETTAATVFSTLGFVVVAPFWLWLLDRLAS